jgi:23S rRNA (cytidine1920-2'-O)/16S rRNA (cytidine1409-2'-O)-methyltransferase
VRRGLVSSRAGAQEAITQGRVLVAGRVADKAASLVAPDDPIQLTADKPFVSRGGIKLDGALDRLDVQVAGRRWLDAGASTGGFTDRLLQGGATSVVAVDVGYGQLDWKLRNDNRVVVMERVNVRELTRADLPFIPDAITADLSFISLALVLPVLSDLVDESGDLVLLVKPQFEVGKGGVGKGGVVRDPALWRFAVSRVVVAAEQLGWGLARAAASELPGPAGNREFFVHLRRDASSDTGSIESAVQEAASEAGSEAE